jgi:hypothetical protein
MTRKTLYRWVVVSGLALAGCSGAPDTPMSPTGVTPTTAALNDDGSSVKITPPGGLNPNGGTINTRRPQLSFTNASGRFGTIGLAYELEVQNASGAVVYSRVIGESATTSAHTLESDLNYSETYWWHVRGRLGEQAGPWSIFAQVRTLDAPLGTTPTAPSGGGLPFPVPAECGPGDPGNRFPCAAAVAAQSVEWRACAGGNGVGCHRFTRQVVFALSQSDPNWKMIQAAPGGHACNCSGCGPSDGTMFREDTTVYGGNRVFDMIVGAGGPTPSLTWSFVGAPRPVDVPGDAPVCQ